MGLGFWGLGFGGLGFRALGLEVLDSGFRTRVQGLRLWTIFIFALSPLFQVQKMNDPVIG